MIYIYKNGKRIKIGNNVTVFIYLDSDNSVVAKSVDRVEGYDKEIEANGNIYGSIVSKPENREYYHQLIGGRSGKSLEDYRVVYRLELLKKKKCDGIDVRTDELIANGIPYDGYMFSTSPEAQRNWIAMFTSKDVLGYPFSVTTLDEKEYVFNDPRLVQLFYLTGISTINYNIATGRAIKLQIMACESKSEVDAIVDPR